MKFDKISRTRYPSPDNSGDMVVDAKGPEALSHEKVDVIGGWIDYTGSGGPSTKQLMMFPITNTLFGTDAELEGGRSYDRDVLGNIKRITRLRRMKKILD